MGCGGYSSQSVGLSPKTLTIRARLTAAANAFEFADQTVLLFDPGFPVGVVGVAASFTAGFGTARHVAFSMRRHVRYAMIMHAVSQGRLGAGRQQQHQYCSTCSHLEFLSLNHASWPMLIANPIK